MNVLLNTYKKKHSMVSPHIGFPRKYWCIVYYEDVFIIVYYALMDVNVYDEIIN